MDMFLVQHGRKMGALCFAWNGQCGVDAGGCTSSCYDNDDDTSEFGMLALGLVIGGGAVVIIGGVAGVVFFLRHRAPSDTTTASNKDEPTKSPFY
jgi:hypothetical protein